GQPFVSFYPKISDTGNMPEQFEVGIDVARDGRDDFISCGRALTKALELNARHGRAFIMISLDLDRQCGCGYGHDHQGGSRLRQNGNWVIRIRDQSHVLVADRLSRHADLRWPNRIIGLRIAHDEKTSVYFSDLTLL